MSSLCQKTLWYGSLCVSEIKQSSHNGLQVSEPRYPWCLAEMHILRSHPRATNSEALGVGPSNLYFNKLTNVCRPLPVLSFPLHSGIMTSLTSSSTTTLRIYWQSCPMPSHALLYFVQTMAWHTIGTQQYLWMNEWMERVWLRCMETGEQKPGTRGPIVRALAGVGG